MLADHPIYGDISVIVNENVVLAIKCSADVDADTQRVFQLLLLDQLMLSNASGVHAEHGSVLVKGDSIRYTIRNC